MAKKKKGLSLIEANPYLHNEEHREELLELLSYESSVFEGAQGLKKPRLLSRVTSAPRTNARSKKRISGS